jgi:hypothetical protein
MESLTTGPELENSQDPHRTLGLFGKRQAPINGTLDRPEEALISASSPRRRSSRQLGGFL